MQESGLRVLCALQDELARAPRAQRLRQLLQVDYALSVIEPARAYPYAFVRDLLLGPGSSASVPASEPPLDGRILIEDLVRLAEHVSEGAQFTPQDWRETFSTSARLAERFNISTKTVSRWHRRGLVAWRCAATNAPTLLFPEHCLRQFVSRNPDLVFAASSFSRLSDHERQAVIKRARELVALGCRTSNTICRRIAAETGRAAETVRQILKRHDQDQSDMPILDRATASYDRADRVQSPTTAPPNDGSASMRIITTGTPDGELKPPKIKFVASPEFAAADADRLILGPRPAGVLRTPGAAADGRSAGGLPAYLASLRNLPLLTPELERDLFRRMNYLKYKAQVLSDKLHPATATPDERKAIGDLLVQAAGIKSEILQANLRLVVSTAKRRQRPGQDLAELISDGNLALLRALDNFDYSRGFKFSTYATWAILNCYARTARAPRLRLQTNREKLGDIVDRHVEEEPSAERLTLVRGAVDRMLSLLNDRERTILSQRYGLDGGSGPLSLSEIGRRLCLSKERIRQLHVRAVARLQAAFKTDAARLLRA